MSDRLDAITNWRELGVAAHYTVKGLAGLCGVPARRLERFFRERAWMAPHSWLSGLRQGRGLSLLLAGKSVKETAYELGYREPCNFSRDFRRAYGVPPRKAALLLVPCVSDLDTRPLLLSPEPRGPMPVKDQPNGSNKE